MKILIAGFQKGFHLGRKFGAVQQRGSCTADFTDIPDCCQKFPQFSH